MRGAGDQSVPPRMFLTTTAGSLRLDTDQLRRTRYLPRGGGPLRSGFSFLDN